MERTDIERKISQVRQDFALLRDGSLRYLDNAATTQKPDSVLRAVQAYYEEENANPFRGVYELSEKATLHYEAARAAAAGFIGANADEIIFTRNATEGMNLLAYSLGSTLSEGDEVVVSVVEHHSNFLPWRAACLRSGAKLVKLECDECGNISEEAFRAVVSERTKIVAMTQLSNVLGKEYDVRNLARIAHEIGAIMVADGAQSVPHMKVDVKELGIDFMAFSGHKMLAPMGIGVLYGRKELLEKMPPFMEGGEMIETVHWDRVRYAEVPHKFEAGTVNVGGAVGLEAAIRYMENIGWELIEEQESYLTELAVGLIKELDGITITGSADAADHKGIVSFTVDGVHPHDVAEILGRQGICVRAGHHCAQPLMDQLGVRSTTRASFAFYNTEEEVRAFAEALGKVRGLMGYA